MRIVLGLLCLLGGVICSQESFAAEPDRKDPVQIYHEAGTSDEQEAKIRQFAQEYEKAARVKVERIRNLTKQITDLSYEAEIDEKKILSTQDEINELQNSLSSERIKLMLRIRGLLSPEQKTKLVELLKEKDVTK